MSTGEIAMTFTWPIWAFCVKFVSMKMYAKDAFDPFEDLRDFPAALHIACMSLIFAFAMIRAEKTADNFLGGFCTVFLLSASCIILNGIACEGAKLIKQGETMPGYVRFGAAYLVSFIIATFSSVIVMG